jgi:hypothetical protein
MIGHVAPLFPGSRLRPDMLLSNQTIGTKQAKNPEIRPDIVISREKA